MNRQRLEKQLIDEFECSRSDAHAVSEKALKLKKEVESDPESWDGPEINSNYIISRLNMAPERLSAIAKWNWWAGMMNYFGGSKQDYRIN